MFDYELTQCNIFSVSTVTKDSQKTWSWTDTIQ